MKFVEYAKMGKKKKKEIDRERRSDWGQFNPTTRVIPNKKKYNRKRDKRNYTI